MKRGGFLAGAVTPVLLSLAACNGAGNSEGAGVQTANAGASTVQDRSFASPAEQLFVEKCSMCHRAFGMGTVILEHRVEQGQEQLEDRDDLTVEYVTTAARQGIGNMPRIPQGEVSDEQLRQIAEYLAGDGN
jgi:mono/diheme cytochrome c family protein